MKKPVNIFLTVDTEHSIGGAFDNPGLTPVGNEKRIFGKIGNKLFGIPLIMDVADHFGLGVTFFLEVLNKYFFGENESKQVCQYILERNHDVQLHMHPNYLNFTCKDPGKLDYSDFMSAYTLDRQTEMIKQAKGLLVKYGAKAPTAFRAGCFGADLNTLKALKKNGFLIDSSFNRAYCGITCSIPDFPINDAVRMEGILEFPVTNFIEHSRIRSKRFMPLDINGVSYREIERVLLQSLKKGPSNITIILHSFSFIKAYDVQYRRVKPRRTVIRRFEKLCRFLAEHSSYFDVKTLGSIGPDETTVLEENTSHSFVRMPCVYSISRGVEQVKDNIL